MSKESKLSHIDETGASRMVDVSRKEITERIAVAHAKVTMKPETFNLIMDKKVVKGDVLGVARVAGIMAAKKTSEIIPLCHPIALSSVTIDLNITDKGIEVITNVSNQGKTGVEMEALTATSVCCLTIYDMTKSIDRSGEISSIKLISKSGGKSGNWKRR